MFITVKDNKIFRFDNDFLVNKGLMAAIDNFTTVKVIVVSVGGWKLYSCKDHACIP